MLKKKDVIAYVRTKNGEDFFLDYHGCEEDLTDEVLKEIEQKGEYIHPTKTYGNKRIVFKKNYEFELELEFIGFHGEVLFRGIGKSDKVPYAMFMVDFARLIETGRPVNKIKGIFTYTKRGRSYAVKLVKRLD